MMNFLKRIFHRHEWEVIEQIPISKTRYHCVIECKKCKKRTSQVIDLNYQD
jgi:hypothetical protein